MSWPADYTRSVQCFGFPAEWLPALRNAIDADQIKWTASGGFAEYGWANFEWAGTYWELEEVSERVIKVSLKGNLPTAEDLTIATLTGKIAT